jgi:hypothetical protein
LAYVLGMVLSFLQLLGILLQFANGLTY